MNTHHHDEPGHEETTCADCHAQTGSAPKSTGPVVFIALALVVAVGAAFYVSGNQRESEPPTVTDRPVSAAPSTALAPSVMATMATTPPRPAPIPAPPVAPAPGALTPEAAAATYLLTAGAWRVPVAPAELIERLRTAGVLSPAFATELKKRSMAVWFPGEYEVAQDVRGTHTTHIVATEVIEEAPNDEATRYLRVHIEAIVTDPAGAIQSHRRYPTTLALALQGTTWVITSDAEAA